MGISERVVQVTNELGLHARPSAEFVKLAARFNSDISVTRDSMSVNGKSILGIMTLAAEQGASLTLRAEGEDAEDAVRALEALIESGFGE